MGSISPAQEFTWACERYQQWGVNAERALETLAAVSLSLPCWQADDVQGFEAVESTLSDGGLAVTGNYPGRARSVREFRADLEMALSLVPGHHRVNLHAMYGDFGDRPVDRDRIGPEHFQSWLDWSVDQSIGLDFNATCFAHPRAADGFTLSSRDPGIRKFWVDHVRRCREIGTWMGQQQKTPCIHNLWIPDGSKDLSVSRYTHRELLLSSLEEIFADHFSTRHLKDSVESKLFGIGSEACVVGSYDFYLAWAVRNNTLLCLDMGHFHPTESIADKISALLQFLDEILIHISRGVHWDSDHVPTQNNDLCSLMEEIIRSDALGRVHLALDFFDGSINRVGAYVIGARAAQKALLQALLQPIERLRESEESGDYFGRLALMEEAKALPFGTIWDGFCRRMNVPEGDQWIESVRDYERRVQSKRE